MLQKSFRYLILFSIILISLLMHEKHFSKDLMSLHVWRQTQTQSTIQSFYHEDMNILNPHRNERGNGSGVFRMEFPIMQWLTACLYMVFGNHIIITRLFMFVIGIFSVFGMYKLLLTLFNNEIPALIGAWAFNFSPCFYYYTINPLPDNFALCASIWGMFAFFKWQKESNMFFLLLSGFFLSLASLSKLPFILYYSVPLMYFISYRYKKGTRKESMKLAILFFSFLLLPLTWYSYVIPDWKGNGIVEGMANNEVPISLIFEYLKHNLISTLPELLLNYASVPFFLFGFYFAYKKKLNKHPFFSLILVWGISILLYFFFEINMIAKIHDYYLFPFYPLLFILVSYGAFNLYTAKYRYSKSLVLIILAVLPLTAHLRMKVRWNTEDPGFNKDLLEYKAELQNAVPKDALCIVGNDESHYIFFYYIDKNGWGFDHDNLSYFQMKKMIREGAKYLYSDSRSIDTHQDIMPLLDHLVLEKGSVRVYELKDDGVNFKGLHGGAQRMAQRVTELGQKEKQKKSFVLIVRGADLE